ncbi:hypothetical protein CJ030_MR3G014618 [Morella rubra]|uniref:DUF674 domain-containing protein n=1 Tax=Morella rubra TaxID=262757 RepID=A0A6A1VYE9_9ROSI|nr:hypothetical protein CJ030_MR3G014618 [Morella rubra]
MASTQMSLKLLIDTRVNRVLFAEAGKDFVDFLFTLLSLPVGTVIRLIANHGMVGSLGNLYGSIENLSQTYLQPNQDKEALLKPKAPISAGGVPLLISQDESQCQKLYMCPNPHRNVADDPNSVCPQCRSRMSNEIPYVARTWAEKASSDDGGYVKGVVTYMVMDDLVVRPMSTISSITMLNKFNITDVASLEEREVNVGMTEVR